MTYILNKDVTMNKGRGTQNMTSKYEQITAITRTTLHDYNNSQIPLEQLASLLKYEIAKICTQGTKDVLDVINSLWGLAGLGMGFDGVFRTQHPEFYKKGNDVWVSIETSTNEDGTESLIAFYKRGNKIIGSQDLTLEPRGEGLRDMTRWIADGWQIRMVDPVTGPHSNPSLATHGLKTYVGLIKKKSIADSFNLPEGTPWQQTRDFMQKTASSTSFARLNTLINPRNPVSLALGIQNAYYNPSAHASQLGATFLPRISGDFPVYISSTSRWSNTQIQRSLCAIFALSTPHLQRGSIPYETSLNPAFYENLWAGNIELDGITKFQFHSDRNTHNTLKQEFIYDIAKLNYLSKTSINHLRASLGYGYGQGSYAMWDVIDWTQKMVIAPGVLNTPLTTKKKCNPYAYYSTIYEMAKSADTYMAPFVADKIMRSYLSPMFAINDLTFRQRAWHLYNNWRSISTRTQWNAQFTDDLDNWKIFLYPSDMRFINNFGNSLELIAYLNRDYMGNLRYSGTRKLEWNTVNTMGLERSMENLAWIYSGSATRPNLFPTLLSNLANDKRLISYGKGLLMNSMSYILAEPWRLASNANPKNSINDFVHNIAPIFYNGFGANSWSSSQPLYLTDFSLLKPFYGNFGEINRMPITMNWINGMGITRDVSWNRFSLNEYDFLVANLLLPLTTTRTTAVARAWVERMWGSRIIGEGYLHQSETIQHRDATGVFHYQFGDFAQRLKGGEALFYEIYGMLDLAYFNHHELKCEAWLKNGYPVIQSPGRDVISSTIFNLYRPQYLIRAEPFFDNKVQSERFQKIVGNIVSESIRVNPANPNNWLHFHNVLFGMHANIQNWGIDSYFSSIIKAENWVRRIQFIFGIHVDPSTLYFDYIINNQGLNIPSSVPGFNPAINLPDSSYDPQMDPFSTQFIQNSIPSRFDDLQNNYKYIWWKNYFDYLAGNNNRFADLMAYLIRYHI